MKKLLIFTALVLLFTGCASSTKDKSKSFKKNVFEHRITYDAKGTRSEARHGFVLINGRMLEDVFLIVSWDEVVYRFYQRKNRWGKDGYFPGGAVDIELSKERISKEELERGWVAGNKKLKGIPPAWIYAGWEKGSAFVSPDKIAGLISALGLKAIERDLNKPQLKK